MTAVARHHRAVFALIACLVMLLAPVGSSPGVTAKGMPLTLYLSDQTTASYIPLDPVTLADDTTTPPLSIGSDYPAWAVSGDGSTMAIVEYRDDSRPTVSIEDAFTPTTRASFEIPRGLYVPELTWDGSLLVLQARQSGDPTGVRRPAWYVFSTSDGRQLAKITGEGQGITPFSFHHALLDPFGERLFVPFVPGETLSDGPLPLQIVSYDLYSGREFARIELPNVLAGSWFPPSDGALGMVNAALTPGVALSPDGRQIAVVDAATGRITLIDAPWIELTVMDEFVPERALGWRQRIQEWFWPGDASAKLMEGQVLHAVFSADGSSLYVTGRTAEIGATMDEIEARGLGIQRIDLAREEVAAVALDGLDVTEVWPSPDGSSLYVYGYDEMWETANGDVEPHLRRLDPLTLNVEAERALSIQHWIVAAPMSPVVPAPDPTTSG